MATMQKDWKYFSRLLLFIPAGYLANKAVLIIFLLVQLFISWRNPPSEFGVSFLEGGLFYFAFGTESGRIFVFLIWTFFSYAMASMAMILASLKVYPIPNKTTFNIITLSMISIFATWLAINLIFLWEQNIKYYTFIIGVAGHFAGALGIRCALRDMVFER